MKIKKIFFTFVFVVSVYAFAETPLAPLQIPEYRFSKLVGNAGPFVSQKAGFETLFTNPALFSKLEKRWNITSLLIDACFLKNKGTMNVTGPLAFGLTAKNFAFGVFNTTRLNTSSSLEQKGADVLFGEELFLTGGYGAEVFKTSQHSISLGIQMKGYFQGFTVGTQVLPENSDATIKELVGAGVSADHPIMITAGLGADVGFLYNYDDFIQCGFVVRDVYTATFSTMYANLETFKKSQPDGSTVYRSPIPTIDVGISLTPHMPKNFATFTGYTFWLQYNDLLSPLKNKRAPYYNLAAGMEFEFNTAYYLRFGFNELVPHFGVGVDLAYFELNLAFKPWEKIDRSLKNFKPSFCIDFSVKL